MLRVTTPPTACTSLPSLLTPKSTSTSKSTQPNMHSSLGKLALSRRENASFGVCWLGLSESARCWHVSAVATLGRQVSLSVTPHFWVLLILGSLPVIDAALGEILTTCSKMEWLLQHGEAALVPSKRSTPLLLIHKSAKVYYEPLGVVSAIVS